MKSSDWKRAVGAGVAAVAGLAGLWLVYAIHDGHVDLKAGILSPFSFGSPYAISSVSVDGKGRVRIIGRKFEAMLAG